jgi:hypothetical protein
MTYRRLALSERPRSSHSAQHVRVSQPADGYDRRDALANGDLEIPHAEESLSDGERRATWLSFLDVANNRDTVCTMLVACQRLAAD